MSVRYLPAGDRGLVVEFGNRISMEINNQVRALAHALEAAGIPGLVEVVPTYRSLGILYDPGRLSYEEAQRRIRPVAESLDLGILPPPKRVVIPTVYGGVYGPDLAFVAQHAGLSEAEVIRLHTEAVYHVYMLGFTPGYTYLGGLPERLHTPRLPSPRLKVPGGSVGIGGSQTGIYPLESPGGWRIIGRTYLSLFDASKEIPTPIQPGDMVQFEAITETEYLDAVGRRPSAVSHEPGTERREAGDRRREIGDRPAIEVLRPGLLTTVQDRGRFGYQRFGVPVSGAMDEVALRVGNVLVGNPQEAAGLEVTALGPQLRFLRDTVVALTGAGVEAELDGRPAPWYRSFRVRARQLLDIRRCTRGLRAYVAIAGGIDVPVLLGSRSTCLVARFGGFRGRALLAGDVLATGSPSAPLAELAGRELPEAWRPRHGSPVGLRVVLGPQADAFTEAGRRTFLESEYRVSPHADRMGYRLDGPVIAHQGSADILSDWIPLGAVQVPGDGKPIILLADRQTTGGYTKIATVIQPDIGLVAQLQPGDALGFRAVSVAEAQGIARRLEADLLALPGRLAGAESWAYAAEVGEVPGGLSPAVPEPPSGS